MIRSYFTKNISGFIDHPDNLSQEDVRDLLKNDNSGEYYYQNKVDVFIHKSHIPKTINDEFRNVVNLKIKSKKLFWRGLLSLFKDFFRV